MRALALVACLGCGGSPPSPNSPPPVAVEKHQEPFWSPKQPKDPPLVKLATKRAFFVIVSENDGKTYCHKWTVEQSKKQDDERGFLVDGDYADHRDTIEFINHGEELELVGRTKSRDRTSASTACSGTFHVTEIDGGLDVDGSKWFDDEAACELAAATKQRVAMDLSTCAWRPAANLQQQAASQRTFEAMLQFGGSAFAIVDDTCQAVRAIPERAVGDDLSGLLFSELKGADSNGRPLRGKSGYQYRLRKNELAITLLGPTSSWSDGSGMGLLCGDTAVIEYGKDSVVIGQTHYLSSASCRAALAREKARRAWLPERTGEERQIAGTPKIGGC